MSEAAKVSVKIEKFHLYTMIAEAALKADQFDSLMSVGSKLDPHDRVEALVVIARSAVDANARDWARRAFGRGKSGGGLSRIGLSWGDRSLRNNCRSSVGGGLGSRPRRVPKAQFPKANSLRSRKHGLQSLKRWPGKDDFTRHASIASRVSDSTS